MEESLIPKEQRKKGEDKKKNQKKKSFFCCCFGSSVDQETDEDHNDDEIDRNGQSNNQDYNMNTAIPNSSSTNQDSEIFASQSNSQRNKAKKSPSKDKKREKDNSYSSRIIKEQGDENNSSSSSQQKANQQAQMQSHSNNFNQKNQIQNSVQNPVINSNKKSQDYNYQNDGDNNITYDQHNQSSIDNNFSKSIKNSTKRHKFNIKAFFQQYNLLQTELFHLYCKKKESYILIKLMEKNFQGNSILGSQMNIGNQTKQSISQKGVISTTLQTDPNSYFYNKNFKSDFDSQFNAIPEPICQYLAQRFKGQMVIDAFCGVGYNTVQFAKEANHVIAVDMNQVKVSHARYNIEQFKLLHKVEVIQSDFFLLKKLRGDVVVLHPDYKKQDLSITSSISEDTIDLFNDVCPNLPEALQAAFQIAPSVVLILQKNCDIQQLPQILDQINYDHKKFGIEIELMHIDRKFNLALVLMGDIASVSKQEMIDHYTKKLYDSTNIQNQTFYSKIRGVVVHVIHISKMKGLSQLIDACERNIENNKNRKTLFQEFYDSINEKKGKIRSSGNLNFEIEGIDTTDKTLKSLLQDIHEILYTNAKISKKSHSPSTNQDIDGYQSSFSYNNNKFDFDSANKIVGQQKKKQLFNQSMQETTNDTSNNFPIQKSGLAANKLKGIAKNQGGNKKVEINSNVSKGQFKGSDNSSNTNNPQSANNQQQHFSEDTNSYANNEFDQPIGQDNEEDYGDSIPKIIYSCSYGTNTLVDSEISDSNSLRPQLSNGIYFNGSTDIYEEEFRNSIMNVQSGNNYYQRPITKPTSSVSGIAGLNRDQFNITGSLPNNGSGKGQILSQISKNQKHNGSKNNLSGQDEHRSTSRMNLYYQQEFEDDGEDFCWEQEEDTDNNKEKQTKVNQTKIKNSNNTYQHQPEMDDSYKKADVFTVPNSLS